jgi:hypothetical protein
MAGHLRRSAGGHLHRNDRGHLVTECETNPYIPIYRLLPCVARREDLFPCHVTVKLEGLTPAGCTARTTGGGIAWVSPPNVNITASLRRTISSASTYRTQLAVSGTMRFFIGSQDCSANAARIRTIEVMQIEVGAGCGTPPNTCIGVTALVWSTASRDAGKTSTVFNSGEAIPWDARTPIVVPNRITTSANGTWIGAFTGGHAVIYPGDVGGGGSCPGGDPVFTDTDLSQYVGKVVKLIGSDGIPDNVWYEVSEGGGVSYGQVQVIQVADSCAEVCAGC